MGAPLAIEDYRALVGSCVGASDWLPVTQDLINQFARCTHDEQFIHVDPARAAEGPFGGTIAHGFLTLSLLSHLFAQAVPKIAGTRMSVNFGFNSIRFLSPVPSGTAIRGRFVLEEFAERKPGQWQSILGVTVELEGRERPALVAEWLVLTVISD